MLLLRKGLGETIGPLTPGTERALQAACAKYPTEWVRLAIERARDTGHLTWDYIAGCLRRAKEQGVFERPPNRPPPATNKAEPHKDPNYYLKGKFAHLIKH